MQQTSRLIAAFAFCGLFAAAMLTFGTTAARADDDDAPQALPISLDTVTNLSGQLETVTDFIKKAMDAQRASNNQPLLSLVWFDEHSGSVLEKDVTYLMLLKNFAAIADAARQDQEDARQRPVNPLTRRTVDASASFLYDLINDATMGQQAIAIAKGLHADGVPVRIIDRVFVVPHSIAKINGTGGLDAALGLVDLSVLALDGKGFNLNARTPEEVSKAVGAVLKVATTTMLLTAAPEAAALALAGTGVVDLMEGLWVRHEYDAYNAALTNYLDRGHVGSMLVDAFQQTQKNRQAKGMSPMTFEAFVGWDPTSLRAVGAATVREQDAKYGFKTAPPAQEPVEITVREVHEHYREVCRAGVCAFQDLGSRSVSYKWYEAADPFSGQPRQVWVGADTAKNPQAARAAVADIAAHVSRESLITLAADALADNPLSRALAEQFGAAVVRRNTEARDGTAAGRGEHMVVVAVVTPSQLVENGCGASASRCPPPSALLRPPCVGPSCRPGPTPIVELPHCAGSVCERPTPAVTAQFPQPQARDPVGGVVTNPQPVRVGSMPDSVGDQIMNLPHLGDPK